MSRRPLLVAIVGASLLMAAGRPATAQPTPAYAYSGATSSQVGIAWWFERKPGRIIQWLVVVGRVSHATGGSFAPSAPSSDVRVAVSRLTCPERGSTPCRGRALPVSFDPDSFEFDPLMRHVRIRLGTRPLRWTATGDPQASEWDGKRAKYGVAWAEADAFADVGLQRAARLSGGIPGVPLPERGIRAAIVVLTGSSSAVGACLLDGPSLC